MNTIFRENIQPLDSSYFVFTSRDTPATFPEHWHTMAEFILSVEDGCHYTVNEEHYILNSGEILLIWPTELHEVISCPNGASIILQFDASLITNCKDFNVYYHSLRNVHHLNKFSREVNDYFRETFSRITDMRLEPFAEPKILIQIYEMMVRLCQSVQISNTTISPVTSDNTFYLIKKACSYIDGNCDHDLPQTEVAQFCGFSSYYFSKIFHKYTGETFPEYLTKKRIALSTQLLQNNSLSIAEVSYQSGFQSISNFNKLFKKHIGCTPMQYRKLYSAN